MADEVLVEKRGAVGLITLNRPRVRNAINLALSQALADAVDSFDADDGVSVILLTGAGGVFSAGMDLKAFAAGERPAIPGRGLGGITERPVRKPLIAAIEGYALAGGLELALAADIIVAARGARMGLPEVTRGLVALGGGLLRIPKSVPMGVAMDWALTGRLFTAEEAHGYGLVARLVDEGTAEKEALALAETIAENAPLALQLTKKIIAGGIGWGDPELYAWHREVGLPAHDSEDAREGATAFVEKRKPVWSGK